MDKTKAKYDYFTFRQSGYGGFDVHGFGTWPRNSCLAGQSMKVFLDRFDTVEEVKAAYPSATGGSVWTDPGNSFDHLSDSSDY